MIKCVYLLILSLIFSLLFNTCCFASNWYQVDKKLWIDLDSTKLENGNILVWQKELNPGTWERLDNKYLWYQINLCKYDCATRKFDYVEVIYYGLKNQVLFSHNFDKSNAYWMNIRPDSSQDKVYNVICRKEF